MNRFRLTTLATLAGVFLAAGCASHCGGCGGGFSRMSMFRARTPCPCECCSNGGGGVPIVGGGGVPIDGAGPEMSEGPLLEPPGMPMSAVAPPMGMPMPGPLPPSLGAPLGQPAVPADPGRLTPIPNMAQPFPAEGSSRIRSR
ncbi:MAG: hypothetical protein ACRELF_02915 [Gemmataceae bacterium]